MGEYFLPHSQIMLCRLLFQRKWRAVNHRSIRSFSAEKGVGTTPICLTDVGHHRYVFRNLLILQVAFSCSLVTF